MDRDDADITDMGAVAKWVAKHSPAVVINCAAYHDVDGCEANPTRAYATNAAGALAGARAADAAGAAYVYVSTDYVFGGTKPAPAGGEIDVSVAYGEMDEPEPRNTYGMSKLAGERLAADGTQRTLVVRVAGLFGTAGSRGKGGNFVETILRRAKAGERLRVVDDQWVSPTYARDAADAIIEVVDSGCDTGIVHATNTGACTWHALAAEAIQQVGLDAPVEAITSAAYGSKARRPANSSLLNDRLAETTGHRPRPWRDALGAYLAEKGHV